MIMKIALIVIFLFFGLIAYSCCCASARADEQSEAYFYLKMQEIDAERRNENLKND